jgi:hypothetical protein
MMLHEDPICTLPDNNRNCTNRACRYCGWNKHEQRRRKALRDAYGMPKGSDGLRSIRLPKERGI